MKKSNGDTNFVCPWCFSKLNSETVLFKKKKTSDSLNDFSEPWKEKIDDFALAFGMVNPKENEHTFFSYSKNCGYTPIHIKQKKTRLLTALFEQESGELFTDRYCRFCFNKLPRNYGIKKSINLAFLGTSDCNVVNSCETSLHQIVKSKFKGIKISKSTNKLGTRIYHMKLSGFGRCKDVFITAYPYIFDDERYKNIDLSSGYRNKILEQVSYNSNGILFFTKLSNTPLIRKLRQTKGLSGTAGAEERSNNCLELEQRESSFRVINADIPVVVDISDRKFLNSVSDSFPDCGIEKIESVTTDLSIKNLTGRCEANEKIALRNLGRIDPFYRSIIDKCFANRCVVETSDAIEGAEAVLLLLHKLDLL